MACKLLASMSKIDLTDTKSLNSQSVTQLRVSLLTKNDLINQPVNKFIQMYIT